MSRERVALFLPSLAGGGAERCTLNIAAGLADHLDVDLVLASEDGPLRSHIPSTVNTVLLGSRRTMTAIPALARYLRSARPCGLLSTPSHANLVAVMAAQLARTGTQVIVTEGSQLSTQAMHGAGARDRLLPTLMRHLFPRATVTAVSAGVAADLVSWVGLRPGSVSVVHNPVMVDELIAKAAVVVEHPWLAENEPPVILAAGRLTTQKDFPNLLQAVALVRRTQDVRAIIIGEGDDRVALELLVRQLGLTEAVDLPGHLENPYPFFAAASVYALSSRWEGLPTVLLEALALGLPIVATDCPSGPREILADGAYGRLVPPGDPAALAEALQRTLKDPRPPDPMLACAPYTLSTIVARYVSLLGLGPSGTTSAPP